MSDAAGIRRKRKMLIAFFSLVLAGLIVYGALRPSEEDESFVSLKDAFLETPLGERPDPEKMKELRKAFDKLSPETKERLMNEIMRERLQEAREKMKEMSIEEKREHVDRMIAESRKNFARLDEAEKARIRERLSSPEGKERIRKSISFYYSEFTPQERELLDPLVNEILSGIGNL